MKKRRDDRLLLPFEVDLRQRVVHSMSVLSYRVMQVHSLLDDPILRRKEIARAVNDWLQAELDDMENHPEVYEE